MEKLLKRSVSLHGVRVGVVVDVILDTVERRPIGFEVRCEDGRHRFLPMAAASPTDREIVIDSPFALLDTEQLEFYRAHGMPLGGRDESAA
ncbi:MAG TPA: PRC-barrel domain-containing protein [Gaiellaceae bacterium]|nr:PRC-barrel domain-containing protein [Gaiellaceae bacterium]